MAVPTMQLHIDVPIVVKTDQHEGDELQPFTLHHQKKGTQGYSLH